MDAAVEFHSSTSCCSGCRSRNSSRSTVSFCYWFPSLLLLLRFLNRRHTLSFDDEKNSRKRLFWVFAFGWPEWGHFKLFTMFMLTWNRINKTSRDFSYLFSSSFVVVVCIDVENPKQKLTRLSRGQELCCTFNLCFGLTAFVFLWVFVIVNLYHRKLNIYEFSIIFTFFFFFLLLSHTQIAPSVETTQFLFVQKRKWRRSSFEILCCNSSFSF